uniref:UBR-type domain-containing protein n=1 Tax=Trichuris muris TaxID=70415 RepID=A0A5S6Q953_TRIMR
MCTVTRLEWSSVVKPLLAGSYANGNLAYLRRLAQTICSCREEIFIHDSLYETFYTTFLALGTHYISSNLSVVEQGDCEVVLAAVRTVVNFIVDRLSRTDKPRLLHSNHFIALLSGLCSGEGSLPRIGVMSLSAYLKSCHLPPHVQATVRRENPCAQAISATVEENSKECSSQPNEGHLVDKVISSLSSYVSFDVAPNQYARTHAETNSTEAVDFKLRFSQENQRLLKELRVGELLLYTWLKSKLITPFKELYELHVVDSSANFILPTDEYERVQRHCLKILERTSNACGILNLPLWDTPVQNVLNSLLDMTGTCLMAAGCALIVQYPLFDEHAEEPASVRIFPCPAGTVVGIITNAKTVCVKVLRILVDSCLDKEQIYKFHLITLGCLAQIFREVTDTVAREIFKPLSNEAAKEFFWLFIYLLRQADVANSGSRWFDGRPGRFNLVTPLLRLAEASVELIISEQGKRTKRVAKEAAPVGKQDKAAELTKLALTAAGSCYDSDAEPILGKWIEDLMSTLPQVMVEAADRQSADGQYSSEPESSVFRPVEEAVCVACESFSMLGGKIFDKSVDKDREKNAFRLQLIEMDIPYVARVVSLLCDADVSDNQTDPVCRITQAFHPVLHNMLVSDGFSDVFASKLLSLTGINLEYSMCPGPFDSQHPLRLKLISQAVFLSLCRPPDKDVDTYRNELITIIWKNAINLLAEAAVRQSVSPEEACLSTDLSYHFAHFLLLFYYSLPRDDKATVIIFTLKTLNRFFMECSSINKPAAASMPLGRLLLLFEILIRYGSSPCPEFIDKVQQMLSPAWFTFQLKMRDPWLRSPFFEQETALIADVSKQLIELASSSSCDEVSNTNHPLVFYQLHKVEFDDYLSDSLDPLAASVLFETDGYDYVYQSLVNLLFQCTEFQMARGLQNNASALFRRYCATTILRITSLLPPSRCFCASVDSSKNESVIRQLFTIVLRTSIRYMDYSRDEWFKMAAVPDLTWKHIQEQMTSPHLMMHWLSSALVLLHDRSTMQSAQTAYEEQDHHRVFRSIITTDLILVHMRIWLHKFLYKRTYTDDELAFIPVSSVLNVLKGLLAHVRMMLVRSCESDLAEVTGVPPSFVVYLLALIGNDKAVPPHRLGELCRSPLPTKLLDTIAEWNELSLDSFPQDFVAGVDYDYSFGLRSVETSLYNLFEAHLANLNRQDDKGPLISLKHAAQSASRFIQDLSRVNFGPWKRQVFKKWYVPLRYDSTAAFLLDYGLISERYDSGHPLQLRMAILEAKYAISNCYELIVLCLSESKFTNCTLLSECFEYLKGCLSVPHEKSILFSTLAADEHVVQSLLRSVESVHTVYLHQLLNFFTLVLREGATSDEDNNLLNLCRSILDSFADDRQLLIDWFRTLMRNAEHGCNSFLLANMSSFVTEIHNFLAKRQEGQQLSLTVNALMDAFLRLFSAPTLIKYLEWKLSIGKPSDGVQRNDVSLWFLALYKLGRLSNTECLPRYLHYVLECCSKAMTAFGNLYAKVSPPVCDGFRLVAAEMVCFLGALIANALSAEPCRDNRDEAVSSDLDNSLEDCTSSEGTKCTVSISHDEVTSSSVCTFTETVRDFKEQHWYFCYDCGLTDGRGVCSVCRRICHLDHDVSYAKYSSFFCDCGSNEGPVPCKALVRQVSEPIDETAEETINSKVAMSAIFNKMNCRGGQRAMSLLCLLFPHLASMVLDETDRDVIMQEVRLVPAFRFQIEHMLELLFPIVHRTITEQSPIGRQRRLASAFHSIQCYPLPCKLVRADNLSALVSSTDKMALSVIGSPYTVDCTTMVSQLLAGNTLTRMLACQVYTDEPEDLFIAVAHEKFKLTIIGMFSSEDDLSSTSDYTRNCTDTFPFMILSVSTSPSGKRLIAVCGVKECQVIRLDILMELFEERCVLNVPSSNANYIVKSVWIPDSTSQLALLLCNEVVIYDLSLDEQNPILTYTLPVGKVVDATFVCQESNKGAKRIVKRQMLVLTSNGEVFRQCLPDEPPQKAEETTFMVEVLKVECKRSADSINCSTLGAGVSIYYSHKLKLLFISYSSGNTFVSRLVEDEIVDVTALDFSAIEDSLYPITKWSEVDNCPGLLLASRLPNRHPMLMYVKPKELRFQEISQSGASNLMDVFLVRRSASKREITFVVLLTESTQLVLLRTESSATSFWSNRPTLGRRYKNYYIEDEIRNIKRRADLPPPLSLFEFCPSVDADFGGKDALAVYNREMLSGRLTSPNTSVIIKKAGGTVKITVTTRLPDCLIRGLRIQLGGKYPESCPSYFEVLGRHVTISNPAVGRWYDVAFSMRESLSILNSVPIVFGIAEDAAQIAIHSILVYAEKKQEFGKSDPAERLAVESVKESVYDNEEFMFLTHLCSYVLEAKDLKNMEVMCSIKNELLLVVMMRLLKWLVGVPSLQEEAGAPLQQNTVNLWKTAQLAMEIMCMPADRMFNDELEFFLKSLFATEKDYYKYKDNSILTYVDGQFANLQNRLDCELFYWIVRLVRDVAITRPSSVVQFMKDQEQANSSSLLIDDLMGMFNKIVASSAHNLYLANVAACTVEHMEDLVDNLVEILFSCIRFAPWDMDKYYAHFTSMIFSDFFLVGCACYVAFDRRKFYFIPQPYDIQDAEEPSNAAAVMTSAEDVSKTDDKPAASEDDWTAELLNSYEQDFLASKDVSDSLAKAIKDINSKIISLEQELVELSTPNSRKGKDEIVREDLDCGRSSVALKNLTAAVNARGHVISLMFVNKLSTQFYEVGNLSGLEAIPYFQVLHSMVCSLNTKISYNNEVLFTVLCQLIDSMQFASLNASSFCVRTRSNEVMLLKLRFFSILLTKFERNAFFERYTLCDRIAQRLCNSGLLTFCYQCLSLLLRYWEDEHRPAPHRKFTRVLLLETADLSPFFLHSFVQEYISDVFFIYHQLITDVVVRLPYQIRKIPDTTLNHGELFNDHWTTLLYEFVTSKRVPEVKSSAKKLLVLIMGSQALYKRFRDENFLRVHVQNFSTLFVSNFGKIGYFTWFRHIQHYDSLTQMFDALNSCIDIATARPGSWQHFLLCDKASFVQLLRISCCAHENIAELAFLLLEAAFVAPSIREGKRNRAGMVGDVLQFSKDIACSLSTILLVDANSSSLTQFLLRFIVQWPKSRRRWQARRLLYAVASCSCGEGQQWLLDLCWNSIWPLVDSYGAKAFQFVDSMCYLTIQYCTPEQTMERFELVFDRFRHHINALIAHDDTHMYRALMRVVRFKGLYLSNNPCSICTEMEAPLILYKLNNLKQEAQYTTTSIRVKLTSYCEISKILLRISETRRKKTVRKISVYFSNHSLSSAVELKRNDIWTLTKEFELAEVQSDVKMEFPVPFITRNLRIEFALFHDKSIIEVLVCPRCSAVVRSHPGVCVSCGENALQCHKCRAINYNERDPFLCNSCGFCKYGKFDFAIQCRKVPGVDQITNDEESRKSLFRMHDLMERAEQCVEAVNNGVMSLRYHMLMNKTGGFPHELPALPGSHSSTATSSSSGLCTSVQAVGQCYNVDCKRGYENLSAIYEEIWVLRMAILEYERGDVSIAVLDEWLKAKPNCLGCISTLGAAYASFVHSCVRRLPACKQRLLDSQEWRAFVVGTAVSDIRFRPRMIAIEMVASMVYNDLDASTLMRLEIESNILTSLSLRRTWSTEEVVNCYLPLLARCATLMDSCAPVWVQCVINIVKKVLQFKNDDFDESLIVSCLRVACCLVKEHGSFEFSSAGNAWRIRRSLAPALSDNGRIPSEDTQQAVLRRLLNVDRKVTILPEDGFLNKKPLLFSALNVMTTSMFEHAEGKSLVKCDWLEKCIFHKSSVIRLLGVQLLSNLCRLNLRTVDIFGYLVSLLWRLDEFDSSRTAQYLSGLISVVKVQRWSRLFYKRGFFIYLITQINFATRALSEEVENLNTVNLSLGHNLCCLSEVFKLMCTWVSKTRCEFTNQIIKQALEGYFVTHKDDVRRSGLLNVARDNFVAVLEEMIGKDRRYLG